MTKESKRMDEFTRMKANLSNEIDNVIGMLEEAKLYDDCRGFNCHYCMDFKCGHICHLRNRIYLRLKNRFPKIFRKRIWFRPKYDIQYNGASIQ